MNPTSMNVDWMFGISVSELLSSTTKRTVEDGMTMPLYVHVTPLSPLGAIDVMPRPDRSRASPGGGSGRELDSCSVLPHSLVG